MDDAEALVIPVGPLEVVHQRPLEVAAHIHPFLDGGTDRAEVGVEIGDAPRVVADAIDDGIVVGAAVLGDVDRRQVRVRGREADQQSPQPIGRDGPAHVGLRTVRREGHGTAHARGGQPAPAGLSTHVIVVVVVDAKPVERLRDALEIARLDGHTAERLEIVDRVRRVAAAEHRLEPHAVAIRVVAAGSVGGSTLGVITDHVDGHEVDDDPLPRPRIDGAHGCDGEAVREVDVVDGPRGLARAGVPRGVRWLGIAQERRTPWLVVRGPQVDPIMQCLEDDPGVVGEAIGGVACGPATGVLERLGQVPVIKREGGRDALLQQAVHET